MTSSQSLEMHVLFLQFIVVMSLLVLVSCCCKETRHEHVNTSHVHVSAQDQADGSGKRRLDNGEVGRWKLTDDPPPKKKAPPSLEEGGRTEGGHKRKKEKELPQDSGAKKRVNRLLLLSFLVWCILWVEWVYSSDCPSLLPVSLSDEGRPWKAFKKGKKP